MRQLKFDQPGLEATLLKPTNECGVEKLICTFVKVLVMMITVMMMILKPANECGVEKLICTFVKEMMMMICPIQVYICLPADGAALLPLV